MLQVVKGITQPLNLRILSDLPYGATSSLVEASCSLLKLLNFFRYRWYMLLTCSFNFYVSLLAAHHMTKHLPASEAQLLDFLPYS